jgi:hypothetical protein
MYGGTFIFICISVLLYTFRDTLFPSPTCFDARQNGFEEGVDCGGVCSLTCTQSVVPLSTVWTRALPTSSSTYDLVAMISNKNTNNAAHAVGYSFTVFNKLGSAVFKTFGTSTAPIDGQFPIIIQNVNLKEVPGNVTVQLTEGSHYKVGENPTSPTVTTSGIRYEGGQIPRVYATINNTKQVTISRLPVRVVLYDAGDNAYAAGETVIPYLNKEESHDIVFTWNYPFSNQPVKIRVYPVLDPFVAVQ